MDEENKTGAKAGADFVERTEYKSSGTAAYLGALSNEVQLNDDSRNWTDADHHFCDNSDQKLNNKILILSFIWE